MTKILIVCVCLFVFSIQVLKKIQGDGQGTMHYVTSVLNEWGQFVSTVVVASESEECYRSFRLLAQGLTLDVLNVPMPQRQR